MEGVRASMGSAFHVPVVRSRALESLIEGMARGRPSHRGTMPRGGTSMYNVDFTKPIAVLLGGEAAGLSEDLAAAADMRVSIPMHGASNRSMPRSRPRSCCTRRSVNGASPVFGVARLRA